MHRPILHDADRRFAHAAEEGRPPLAPIDRVKRRSTQPTCPPPRGARRPELALRERKLSPRASASAEKGLTELRDALGDQAYWKAPTWKRLVAIMAGPGANVALTVVLFAVLTTVGGRQTIASVAADSPAEAAGLPPATR